jgi:hypothetical protein
MKRALLLCVLIRCGPPPGELHAQLFVSQALAAGALASMDVFVLSSHDAQGKALHCSDLTGPLLAQPNLVTEFHRFLPVQHAHLDTVPAGQHLIVAIDAYGTADGSGARVAHGCAENVTIDAGKTASVNLVLTAD